MGDRTVKSYLGWVKQLGLHFDKRPLPDLESRYVLDFLIHLQVDRKLAGATVNQALCAIRMFYRDHLGLQWKIWSDVKIAREETLPTVLSRSEVAHLLDTCRCGFYRAFFTLIYQQGMRVSEAANLRPQDIIRDRMVIRIRKGKGAKAREVPLSPRLLERLQLFWCSHRNPQWLFPGAGRGWKASGESRRSMLHRSEKPLSNSTAWNAFKVIKIESGLDKKHPELRIHTLRHSYATHMLEEGVSLRQISALLGHASLKPTLIYLHLTEVSEQKAREALERLAMPNRRDNNKDNKGKVSKDGSTEN